MASERRGLGAHGFRVQGPGFRDNGKGNGQNYNGVI